MEPASDAIKQTRGPQTRFFSFVDTVSARNFAGTNEPHGWMGLRFQLHPGGLPNDVLLHINLLDPSNLLQQEAIGILGVNLIYAAFHELQTKESFLEGLAQDVVKERIEIDYVDLRGAAFESWIAAPCSPTWCTRDSPRLYFSPRRAPAFRRPRLSTRKPSCLRREL